MAGDPDIELIHVPCSTCGADDCTLFATGQDHEYSVSAQAFSMVTCNSCGHLYLNPRPADHELARIHPDTYYAYANDKGSNEGRLLSKLRAWRLRRMLRPIVHRILGPRPLRILDVGCSDGRMLSHLRSAIEAEGGRVETVGVEMSSTAAALARGRGHEVHAQRFEEATLSRASFDLVCSFHVLPHVSDPQAFLQALVAVTKPGGFLLLDTMNTDTLDFQLLGKSGHWGGYHFPRHWNLYNAQTLAQLAQRCGLEVLEVTYIANPILWMLSLHSLLGARAFSPSRLLKGGLGSTLPQIFFTLVEHGLKLTTGKTACQRVLMRRR